MSKILTLASELTAIQSKTKNGGMRHSKGLDLPRGIRNNNPGNIQKNPANRWEGRIPLENNTDTRFEQFTTYAYGVRALIMLLRTYINSGKNSITAIFSAYAPPGENNTQQYIDFVAERLRVGATAQLSLSKNVLRELAKAIARMENGQECISDAQFEEAWELLSTQVRASIAQIMSLQKSTYSKPFYDTGEHAILGEYTAGVSASPIASVDALQPTRTFSVNGVPFTYGQIITMGDFFEDYNEMVRSPARQLDALKSLINQSEIHYQNAILGIGSAVSNVSDGQWAGASPRYIDLALKNNSHFGPPSPGATVKINQNNKLSWETYHGLAIQKVRTGLTSDDLEIAYTINAFGDHFLTDAFSAGHLFNKELVMEKFLSKCISGASLTSAANTMLERIAAGALANRTIKTQLGQWEVIATNWKMSLFSLGAGPDLDTQTPAKVFEQVLKGVLLDKDGREEIANLSVKAVHDDLNHLSGGLPVTNAKGISWRLTGDGTLNRANINQIQLAIKQSVENILDAVTSTESVSSLCKKVWDFVPDVSVSMTKTAIDNSINTFTDPSSAQLVTKAVSLLESQLPVLLEKLKSKGLIKRK
jgi:hypothetical protein